MVKAVLDPGVLVSAAISPQGAPRELLRLWLEGEFELMISPKLLGELESVLKYDKFRKYLSLGEVEEYPGLFQNSALRVDDPPAVSGLTPDPGDDHLVNLARSCDAHFLISGDPHLVELDDPRFPVLTPRAFLKWLQV